MYISRLCSPNTVLPAAPVIFFMTSVSFCMTCRMFSQGCFGRPSLSSNRFQSGARHALQSPRVLPKVPLAVHFAIILNTIQWK